MAENLISQAIGADLAPSDWWGERHLQLEQKVSWDLGSLVINITRLDSEYDIHFSYTGKPSGSPSLDNNLQLGAGEGEKLRFACEKTLGKVKLQPTMADRPVVARPIDPVLLLPNQKTTLYISTPIWIAVYLDDNEIPALDIPVIEITSTWFGPSPRVGELCYGGKIAAYSSYEKLVANGCVATLPIVVQNQNDEILKLERINIPVPYLDLLHSGTMGFWMQGIELIREHDKKDSKVRMLKGTRQGLGELTKVSASRKHANSIISKTFDSLFG